MLRANAFDVCERMAPPVAVPVAKSLIGLTKPLLCQAACHELSDLSFENDLVEIEICRAISSDSNHYVECQDRDSHLRMTRFRKQPSVTPPCMCSKIGHTASASAPTRRLEKGPRLLLTHLALLTGQKKTGDARADKVGVASYQWRLATSMSSVRRREPRSHVRSVEAMIYTIMDSFLTEGVSSCLIVSSLS